MTTPEQELTDLLLINAERLNIKAFDELPRLNTPYPFIVIDNVSTANQNYKTAMSKELSVDIHVWGSETQRPKIIQIVGLFTRLMIANSEHYRFRKIVSKSNSQQLTDDSIEGTRLRHAIVRMVFSVYSKTKE